MFTWNVLDHLVDLECSVPGLSAFVANSSDVFALAGIYKVVRGRFGELQWLSRIDRFLDGV